MKKSVIAALTGALVVGATATTFAAANPFSDVPAGHWAYNSVTKLASEGVIEGYGDGTFLGNRNITRYEMAQMIAKAMAKNPSGASKAELDKLAAEFRNELDSLGVRVSELEKHSDMVQWTGELRYRYWNDKRDLIGGGERKATRNQLQIRLFPTAEVNEHWKAKARFTATNNVKDDTTTDLALTYVYAEGKYKNFEIDLGKMPLYSNADSGIVADDFFSGGRLIFGDKFKVLVEGGRWSTISNADPADYVGADLLYDNSKLNFGVGYRHFSSDALTVTNNDGSDDANIWSVGAGYKFGDVKLSGAYAENTEADYYKRGYNIELAYAGANRKKEGSWGVFAAYRYVGANVGFAPTFDPWFGTTNKKGVEAGLTWSPLKNTLTKVSYFSGKTLDTKQDDKTIFARVSLFF